MALILNGSTGVSTTNGTTIVADGAIGTNQLASDAVTTSKIATGAVGTTDIADSAITTAKITDANITGAKLENSGVTAGSYGSSSAIPVVTVDAKGRLTSVSTASITSSAPTTAQVLSATAGLSTWNVVGSYGYATDGPAGSTLGNTTAGSNLYFGSPNGTGSTTASGTWRYLGSVGPNGGTNGGLFLRIS